MRIREYGSAGPGVIVLHGGPGAPGYVAPVARELAGPFRVLEPFQRGRDAGRLTVARHVADLDELVGSRCPGERPALVGHSWGAMLALAYAAAHPQRVGPLVLIGCGTFDRAARDRLEAVLDQRMDAALRRRLADLPIEIPDPDERLQARGRLLLPAYSHDIAGAAPSFEPCDARAHEETWEDMMRLQEAGTYPSAFVAIDAPVLMIHGADDPHPGRLIRASLEPFLPQLEYVELARCGHYPWLERAARGEFFDLLRGWLNRRSEAGRPGAGSSRGGPDDRCT